MKLLVVDDHPLMGETVHYIIKNKRPKIEYLGQALSGMKGIEMVKKKQPDIILADIMMPGMDGLTMVKHLKELYPQIIVVIVTAFEDFTYIQQALRMGTYDYLLKPFSSEHLLNTLDKILEQLEKKPLNDSNSYPILVSHLYHKLSNQIQADNILEASCLFEEIWEELSSSAKEDTSIIRTRSIEIAAAIIHLINEKNYCNEAIALIYSSFISNIANAQKVDLIESCLKDFFNSFVNVINHYKFDAENEQIERIKKLIETNLKENITLESIAQKVYITPTYLSRLFKRKVKVNFMEYLINLRLKKAKTLLITTNEKVEVIAIESGYNNANSFRRLFKKKLGISPSEYRESHKKTCNIS